MKTELETVSINQKETPLGWKVNLLNILSASLMCLVTDIDNDLRKIKLQDGSTLHFKHEKKALYNAFCSYLRNGIRDFHNGAVQAEITYNKLDIDGQVWNIVGGNADCYDNFTADAKELLRAMMLYFDRARTDKGFYSIFRFLRELPSGGVFPDSEIEKFNFKRPLMPCPGATVKTTNYGAGVIRERMNGDNWLIDMSDGTQRILTSKQFTIEI